MVLPDPVWMTQAQLEWLSYGNGKFGVSMVPLCSFSVVLQTVPTHATSTFADMTRRRIYWTIYSESNYDTSTMRAGLYLIFSLVVNLCNWKLSWLLPKHIPMYTLILVHLYEYLYEMYHFLLVRDSNFNNSISVITKFTHFSCAHVVNDRTGDWPLV